MRRGGVTAIFSILLSLLKVSENDYKLRSYRVKISDIGVFFEEKMSLSI